MIKKYIKNGQIFYAVRVSMRDKNRKQLKKEKTNITSERKAKEWENNLRYELKALAKKSNGWTFEKWYKECLRRMRQQLKQSTVSYYEGWFKKWVPKEMTQMLLTDFTREYIQDFLFNDPKIDLLENVTKKNILSFYKRTFRLAIEEGIILRNPCRGILIHSEKKNLKVLNADEIESLLTNAKELGHEFYPVWMVAVFTGMRSGEMYALRWRDVDLEAQTILVDKQWTSKDGIAPTKTKKSRIVPISDDLLVFLKEEKLKNQRYTATLFDSRSKSKVTWDDFVLPRLWRWNKGEQAPVLRDFCEIIGITSVRFHDLRASFITNMLAQGVPLVKVMSIVGHNRMATTDGYLRLAGVGLEGTTNQLGYSAPKAKTFLSKVVLLSDRNGA